MAELERPGNWRELHDEASQSLTVLKVGLALLEREYGMPFHRCPGEFPGTELLDVCWMGCMAWRSIYIQANLDRLGLVPALNQYIQTFRQQSNLNVELLAGLKQHAPVPGTSRRRCTAWCRSDDQCRAARPRHGG